MDYSKLQKHLLQSKPSCSAAVPFMYQFVLKFGAEDLLLRTVALGKTRNVGKEIYEVLCQDPKPALSDPLLHVRHSMLRMAYTGPERILSSSDFKRLFQKDFKNAMEKCNLLLMDVNEKVKTQHASVTSEMNEALLVFEQEMILCTLGKVHKDVVSRDSIEEAAVHLVDALETLTGTRLSNQWNAAKKEGQPAPAAAPAASSSSANTKQSQSSPLILGDTLKVSISVSFLFLGKWHKIYA